MRKISIILIILNMISCSRRTSNQVKKIEEQKKCISKKVDSLFSLTAEKIRLKTKPNKKRSEIEFFINQNCYTRKHIDTTNKNSKLEFLLNKYIKKSDLLLKSITKNILFETKNNFQLNIYSHFEVLELIRHYNIAKNNLQKEIDNNKSKKWFNKLFNKKEDTRNFESYIIERLKNLRFDSVRNKKYTFNREWLISRNTDSTYSNLIELYIRDKDTIATQEINYNEGVIDSTSSDFYRVNFKKINDSLYKGKIIVYNNLIHSLKLKLNSRNLSLVLLDNHKIINVENQNFIEFTTKSDTISGILGDRCFFETDSLKGKPMLRYIEKERPIDNKYRTNNKAIFAFDLMKNKN